MARKGITAENRNRLEILHRRHGGPFSVSEAAATLSIDRTKARRLVAQFASQGWLARIRRNAYRVVPLGATAPSEWREDPWLVAFHTFAPCYLGGWTACEHWALTEQLFRDVLVVTTHPVRHRDVEIQGTRYLVKVFHRDALFGLRPVWRGQTQVQLSDPTRTLVDVLDDPWAGGGIRHVADVVHIYFGGTMRDDRTLREYATRLGNRTVFKRLGYLLEALDIDSDELTAACQEEMSRGVSPLDPSGPAGGRIVKRWNLRINVEGIAPREMT